MLIAVFDGPLGLTRRTAPLQLHAIAMKGVLEANAAQRVTLLAYFGDAKRNGCVRRRHEPRAYHLRAFENVDRDQDEEPPSEFLVQPLIPCFEPSVSLRRGGRLLAAALA